MGFLHRKCSHFKKIKQTIIHSHWYEYLSVMCTFLLRSGHKLQNMFYGIEALHNYGNECNTDRGVVIGNLLSGVQTLICQQRRLPSIAVSKNFNGQNLSHWLKN